jgi:lantibiotic modifying enzyme
MLNRIEHEGVEISSDFLLSLAGIGAHIEEPDISDFSDSLIRLLIRQTSDRLVSVQNFVNSKYYNVPHDSNRKEMEERLSVWIETRTAKTGSERTLERLNKLAANWSEILF